MRKVTNFHDEMYLLCAYTHIITNTQLTSYLDQYSVLYILTQLTSYLDQYSVLYILTQLTSYLDQYSVLYILTQLTSYLDQYSVLITYILTQLTSYLDQYSVLITYILTQLTSYLDQYSVLYILTQLTSYLDQYSVLITYILTQLTSYLDQYSVLITAHFIPGQTCVVSTVLSYRRVSHLQSTSSRVYEVSPTSLHLNTHTPVMQTDKFPVSYSLPHQIVFYACKYLTFWSSNNTLQLISGAFEHFHVAYTGNLWFVLPIDCNVKHCIFQSIKYAHGMFEHTRNQLYEWTKYLPSSNPHQFL